MDVLGDDMGGWEELLAELIGELGIRCFPELSHHKFFLLSFLNREEKKQDSGE
jgi:hypothetical protein